MATVMGQKPKPTTVSTYMSPEMRETPLIAPQKKEAEAGTPKKAEKVKKKSFSENKQQQQPTKKPQSSSEVKKTKAKGKAAPREDVRSDLTQLPTELKPPTPQPKTKPPSKKKPKPSGEAPGRKSVAGVQRPERTEPDDARFRGLPCDEQQLIDGAMYMKRIYGDDGKPLKRQLYYHGLLPRDEIERMLKKNGEFLVRETEINEKRRVPTLSVCCNGTVIHFVLGQTKTSGLYHLGYHLFDSIKDLIDWYMFVGRPLSESTGAVLRHPMLRQNWQLSHDQLKKVQKLGEGAFGEVFKGILIDGTQSQLVAIKIQRNVVSDKKERLEFLKEFRTMRNFDHPNVVKVFGVAAEEEPMMIVLEFLPHGSLLSYLRQHTIFIRLGDRIRIIYEASAGLRYLEKNKCMHRDVASRNCLLGPNKEIKIADFGLSRFDVSFKEEKGKKVPIKWLAPETLRTGNYTMANDVWSFGVLLWEIFADGAEPYPGLNNSAVRKLVTSKCYRMKPPSGTPSYIATIMIDKCWNEDPTKRATFEKIHKKMIQLHKTYL